MDEYGASVEFVSWENWNTQRKTCSNTTLSTSNPAWSGLEYILCFHIEGPVAGYLNHSYGVIWCIWRFHFLSYITSVMLESTRINLPSERIIVPTSRTSTVLLLVWSNTMKASIIFLSSTVNGSVKCNEDSGSAIYNVEVNIMSFQFRAPMWCVHRPVTVDVWIMSPILLL
jgi:hypothetical protein